MRHWKHCPTWLHDSNLLGRTHLNMNLFENVVRGWHGSCSLVHTHARTHTEKLSPPCLRLCSCTLTNRKAKRQIRDGHSHPSGEHPGNVLRSTRMRDNKKRECALMRLSRSHTYVYRFVPLHSIVNATQLGGLFLTFHPSSVFSLDGSRWRAGIQKLEMVAT